MTCCNSPAKHTQKSLLKEFNWPLLKDLLTASYTHYFTNGKSSQDLIDIAQKHNAPFTQAFILDIANAQKPMPGMQAIVQELHNLGYRQQIGSNIGRSSFDIVSNPRLSPELAPLFSNLEIDTATIIEHGNGAQAKKPDPAFFTSYLNQNNINLSKQPVILIDDTWANVATAKKLGFNVLYFRRPEQLRDELIKHGIPVTPPACHLTNQRNNSPLYDYALFTR